LIVVLNHFKAHKSTTEIKKHFCLKMCKIENHTVLFPIERPTEDDHNYKKTAGFFEKKATKKMLRNFNLPKNQNLGKLKLQHY